MMERVGTRDVAIAYNNLVSLETYLIVLRNELLRSMTIHNLVPPFLIGEESLFLNETAEVTVNIGQATFVPFMMRRWDTSPILLLNCSLWINTCHCQVCAYSHQSSVFSLVLVCAGFWGQDRPWIVDAVLWDSNCSNCLDSIRKGFSLVGSGSFLSQNLCLLALLAESMLEKIRKQQAVESFWIWNWNCSRIRSKLFPVCFLVIIV